MGPRRKDTVVFSKNGISIRLLDQKDLNVGQLTVRIKNTKCH
jgi:hypothetical protein